MSWFMVDIEADGPIPGDDSMISFGAVVVEPGLERIYKGLVGDMAKNFKHLRKTRHTHHPLDAAKGNAEALLAMRDEMNLKIRLS